MAGQNTLTEDTIDQIHDFAQALPYFTENNFSLQGVTDLFTAKLHLRRYVQERDGVETSLKDATSLVLRLKEEHDKVKGQLQGFYQRTNSLLPDLDAAVSNQQGLGQLTSEFSQRLELSVTKLKSPKCPILIAGETSSGKSSLLNLVLGEQMLPTSTLSSTSIICELRYGEQRKAKIFKWNGEEIEVSLEDPSSDQKSLEKLSIYIHQKGDREQETFEFKRAEIYLPLEFLKEGITIVDSPGVGESEKMDEVVFDYMEEAFAFIYVINSANAGGIQKDRLGKLLTVVSTKGREQLEAKPSKSNPSKDTNAATFSPRAAIFVCNKWDQVPAHEAQTVKKEQLRVLKRYWHGCTDDQVFRLCTTDAAKALEHGVVMKDFRELLDGIERLIPISLQNKLQVYYSLLEQVLCRIKFVLDATVENAAETMTNEERRKRLHKAETNFNFLKRNASDTIENMKVMLEGHVDDCVVKISSLLENNPRVQELATSWGSSELTEQSDIQVVKKKVESEVCLRLQNFIIDWEGKEGYFKEAKDGIEKQFREQLSEIEEAMSAVERSLVGQGDEDDTNQLDLSMAQVIGSDTGSSAESVFDLTITEKVLIGVSSPLWIPAAALGALLSAPAMFFVSPKGIFKKLGEMKAKRKFNEDKLEFMRKQGLKVLAKFKERDSLRAYVVQQMKPSYLFLDSCEQSISEAIASNLNLVEHLKKDARSVENVRRDVEGLRKKVDNIHEELTVFGVWHVKAFDYDNEQLTVRDTVVSSGTFGDIARGQLRDEEAASRDVLVKISKEKSDAAVLRIVSEDKCLRRTIHPNIILLMGTAKGPDGMPLLVLHPASMSLRSFLGRRKSMVTSDNVRRALLDVGKGLEYLHKKGMVHIELSMDTVLVTNEGKPKLTNPCEPRRPMLPETADALASPYVYLPPEALRGGIYKKSADMYSVGLMMWEMWSLKKISEVDGVAGLRLNQIMDGSGKLIKIPDQNEVLPTYAWRSLMTQCLNDDPRGRLGCTEWLDILKNDKIADSERVEQS